MRLMDTIGTDRPDPAQDLFVEMQLLPPDRRDSAEIARLCDVAQENQTVIINPTTERSFQVRSVRCRSPTRR